MALDSLLGHPAAALQRCLPAWPWLGRSLLGGLAAWFVTPSAPRPRLVVANTPMAVARAVAASGSRSQSPAAARAAAARIAPAQVIGWCDGHDRLLVRARHGAIVVIGTGRTDGRALRRLYVGLLQQLAERFPPRRWNQPLDHTALFDALIEAAQEAPFLGPNDLRQLGFRFDARGALHRIRPSKRTTP